MNLEPSLNEQQALGSSFATNNSQTPKYVNYSDFLKMKARYEKSEKRVNKLKSENSSLKTLIEEMIKHISITEDAHKSITQSVENVQESYNLIINSAHLQKEYFSIKTCYFEYIPKNDNKSSRNSTASTMNLNNNMKKLEDMEIAYDEMSKNFQMMIVKYKILKEENSKNYSANLKLIEAFEDAKKTCDILTNELKETQISINRYKQIDKCLRDTCVNSIFLNTNEHRKSLANEKKLDAYVVCEPVSSFVKFLNKY